MSSLTNWWKNCSSRKKTSIIVLLVMINLLLVYQLNNDSFFNGNMPSTLKPSIQTTTLPPAQKSAQPILQATALTLPGNLRDPFLPPAGLSSTVLGADPSSLPANNERASAAPATTTAERKPAVAKPILTGIIVGESGKKLAIIEYNGSSRYYALYDEVGPFNLSAIGSNSVTLAGSNGSVQLTLRR